MIGLIRGVPVETSEELGLMPILVPACAGKGPEVGNSLRLKATLWESDNSVGQGLADTAGCPQDFTHSRPISCTDLLLRDELATGEMGKPFFVKASTEAAPSS